MDKRKKSPLKHLMPERRTSVDSFIFYPVQPDFQQFLSADSGAIPSMSSNSVTISTEHPNILSNLLYSDVPLVSLASTSHGLDFVSETRFSHPPAQLVEDLSLRSSAFHTPLPSTNWFANREGAVNQ